MRLERISIKSFVHPWPRAAHSQQSSLLTEGVIVAVPVQGSQPNSIGGSSTRSVTHSPKAISLEVEVKQWRSFSPF